jgi:hypothetical protein
MTDLSPEHQALMKENPVEQLRQLSHRDFTPSIDEIISTIRFCIDDQVLMELNCFREGKSHLDDPRYSRVTERLNLSMRALREQIITSYKCKWGDWVACA